LESRRGSRLRPWRRLLSVMVGLLGEDCGRCGLSAGTTTHQSHLIPHSEFAAFDHKTVERELAVETPVNVTGDVLVPDLRVRVVRGHDAAQAQILDPNAHRADAQAGAWPLALGQPVDAADHDVRPQATMVVTEGGDGGA